MDSLLSAKCRHCGESVKRLMLLAMLQDAGCSVYPSATHCTEDTQHDFSELDQSTRKEP